MYSPLSHLSFVRSKTGPAEADLWDLEALDHVAEREDLGLFCAVDDFDRRWRRHAAAHEAEKVDEGVGEEAGLTVVDEGDGIFALGDLGFVEVAQERHVPEARLLPPEGLVEEDVFRGRGDPFLGADDVGDAHEVVVDDVGEVVGGKAVGLHKGPGHRRSRGRR